MKLKINKACDLASISLLPPRRTRRNVGAGATAAASAAAAGAAASQHRSQSMSQQSFSQGVGASFSQSVGASFSQGRGGGGASFSQGSGGGGVAFSQVGGAGAAFSQGGAGGGAAFSQGGGGAGASQGGGGGGAAFSQAGGGGGAAFSQGGGGGGAAFSQGGGSASLLHSQSQISQASLDENLLSLHQPSPARHQRFALPDDSSKRMSSFPANSASVVREESQLQLAKISSTCNPIHRWNHSLPDSRCQMNEDVERKFQHLASSVHKMGMVLDSVQNDVMQINRAVKEASLDSDSVQKKFVLLENSLQQIVKGQDDLKGLLEGSTKSNPEQLAVLNSHTSKLDEISSTLTDLPKQVQADLKQLKGDIMRIFTKEMEGIIRAVRSLGSRPDATQTLGDQSCTTKENLLINQTPVANRSPLMNQRPAADGRPQMNQPPVANGRSQMNQTQVANGRPQKKQTPVANGRPQMNHAQVAYGISKMNQVLEANGKPLMKQVSVAKVKVKDLKPKVEQGKAKAGALKKVASSYRRLAPPKQEELGIQNVNPQAPIKKAPLSIIIDLDNDEEEEGSGGSASCVVLKTGTGAGCEEMSEDAMEILRRARKRRRREQSKADSSWTGEDATGVSTETRVQRKVKLTRDGRVDGELGRLS